jgi:hypothetical protein
MRFGQGIFRSCHCQAGVWQQQRAVATLILRQGLCSVNQRHAASRGCCRQNVCSLAIVETPQRCRCQGAAGTCGTPPAVAAMQRHQQACSR